jgi:hypothetical protein
MPWPRKRSCSSRPWIAEFSPRGSRRSLEDLQGWKRTAFIEDRVLRVDGEYRSMLHQDVAVRDRRGQLLRGMDRVSISRNASGRKATSAKKKQSFGRFWTSRRNTWLYLARNFVRSKTTQDLKTTQWGEKFMATNERSTGLAGVDFAGQNHVCAFFNTMDEEHRVLGPFHKVVSTGVKRLPTSSIRGIRKRI